MPTLCWGDLMQESLSKLRRKTWRLSLNSFVASFRTSWPVRKKLPYLGITISWSAMFDRPC